MNYKNLFKKKLKNCRIFGDTTFLLEKISNITKEPTWEEFINFEFDKYSIAENGGCIAVAHERNKDENGYINKIHVYDSYCNIISIISSNVSSIINSLFITSEECLIIVYINGIIRSYNLRGVLLDECSTYESHSISISFVCFWNNGLLIISTNNKIYKFDNFINLKPKIFCHYAGDLLIGGFIIPGKSDDYELSLWSYDSNGKLILIQENDYQIEEFPILITNICFSPDYSMVLVSNESKYLFCDSELTKIYLNIEFEDIIPKKIFWCGSDTILLLNENNLYMIGVENNVIKWEFSSLIGVKTEIDGVRIFSKDGTYLLRSIPLNVYNFALFNQNTISVKLFLSMLNDEELALKDLINEFTLEELQESIEILFEVSLFFNGFNERILILKVLSRIMNLVQKQNFDSKFQNLILLQIKDFQLLAEILSTLRVCEQISREPYNIPMTYNQFKDISSSIILKRLCNRSLHFEAYRIALYLSVDTELISAHWAHCLIHTSLSITEIIKRLKKMKDPIDYVDLAATSFNINKNELAIALLEKNPSKALSVPLLIKREKWKEALTASIESSDTSLIIYSLKKIFESGLLDLFNEFILNNKIARDSWKNLIENDKIKEIDMLTNKIDLIKTLDLIKNNEIIDLNYLNQLKKNKKNLLIESLEIYQQILPFKLYLEEELNISNVNLLTINEIVEQIILNGNKKKQKEISKILDFYPNELNWRRALTAIKFNKLEPVLQIYQEIKYPNNEPFINYFQKLNFLNGIKVLNGIDINSL